MFRAAVKSLLARKMRLLLTTLSIVLGVGFMAGTFVLTDTMAAAFDDVFATASEGIDVIVRAENAFSSSQAGGAGGGGGFEDRATVPDTLLEDVRAIDGVAGATGDVGGYAQLVDPATGDPIGGLGPPTIGTTWDPNSPVLELRSGGAPNGPGEFAVDAATAGRYDLAVGQDVQVIFQSGPESFTISGIVGFGDADNLGGATLALFDFETAQRVFDKQGELDSISVTGEEGIAAGDLRARIVGELPDGVEAITGTTLAQESSDAIKEALGFFNTALLVFALVALFVGGFIIFNTFSIIVAQRTRELALLRALGASRRQVTASVLVEALLVGLVASALGVVVGIGIAIGLKAMLDAFGIEIPSTETQLLARTIVVSVVLGTVVTVASSVLPARRAARVAPVEAMRDTQQPVEGASLHRRISIGVAVTGLGVAGVLYGLFGAAANQAVLVGVGVAVTFVGVSILSPAFARPLAGGIGTPIRRLGVPARLGRENSMRNPRRTAATAAALMIGLGLVCFVAVLASSLKASAEAALDETLKADVIVTTPSFTSFSTKVADDVQTAEGIAAVTQVRQDLFRFEGSNTVLNAVDPATIERTATLDLLDGSVASLSAGEVLVWQERAADNAWSVGDSVPMEFAVTGLEEVRIGGIYEDNRLLNDFVVSLDFYEERYTEKLDSFLLVAGEEGTSPERLVSSVERAVGDFPGIDVQDQAAFKEKQAGFVDQLLNLITALLALAILIALFGIVNTLSLSIYERTRELGLLRAVGMTRRQVRSMVRWESVLIALIGAVLGAVIGVLFGWAMQQALVGQGLTVLNVPVGQLAAYVVFAGVAGVFAAILPARRAARLDVLRAIAYE